MKLLLLIIIFNVALILFGCKKTIEPIDNRLMILTTNLSIDTDFNVVEFDFVNEDLIFAICKKNYSFKIFKSIDGGDNWSEMINPELDFEYGLDVQCITFYDEDNGIVVINSKAYRTFNGGITWTPSVQILPPPGESYAMQFIYAVKRIPEGDFLLFEASNNSYITNRILSTNVNSPIYHVLAEFPNYEDYDFDYGSFNQDKFFYLNRDIGIGGNYSVFQLDINTFQMDTIFNGSKRARDAVYENGKVILAEEFARISIYEGSDVQKVSWEDYDLHFNAVETFGDYQIVIAKESIRTNYNGFWESVYTYDDTDSKGNFINIKKIDEDFFYLSGEEGLFLKVRIDK